MQHFNLLKKLINKKGLEVNNSKRSLYQWTLPIVPQRSRQSISEWISWPGTKYPPRPKVTYVGCATYARYGSTVQNIKNVAKLPLGEFGSG
jgi:hypothetical protein